MHFYLPVKVSSENGCVANHRQELAALGSKALIVTGKSSAQKNGSLEGVPAAPEAEGRSWVLFDEVEENPSVETVTRAAQLALENGADFVIGIGGGSPLDAAKSIAWLMKNDSRGLFDESAGSDHVPLAAVPTTCGTGSEATSVSVLTRHELKTKQSMAHPFFFTLSLVDGKYLKDAPLRIIRETAVDALSHMWEGWQNTRSTDFSHMFVKSGLEVWSRSLPVLRGEKEADDADRQNLMNAATMAGMAIAHTKCGVPHALSYGITYHLGVPHGRAVGMFQAGYLEEADPQTRNALLTMAGFRDLDDFDEFFNTFLGRPQVPDWLADEIAEKLAANKPRLAMCPYPMDKDVLLRIVKRV